MTRKVLTANCVRNDARVWLGASGQWVHNIDEAFVARHAEAIAGLEEVRRVASADNRITNVAVIDIEEIGTRRRPLYPGGQLLSFIGNCDHGRKAAA